MEYKWCPSAILILLQLMCLPHWSIGDYTISFTQLVYNVSIFQDPGIQEYVTPGHPHMGVEEPSNLPNHSVMFSVLDSSQTSDFFVPETFHLGNFYFLRLRTSYFADINREKQSIYELKIEVILRSGGLSVKNTTRVIVNVLDKNENCPLFRQDRYTFSVLENATTLTQFGSVTATDADAGINAQVFYYFDPSSHLPFRVDPHDGSFYPTDILDTKTKDRYSFYVEAIHRGDRTVTKCDGVSRAPVTVTVLPTNSHKPEISVSKMSEIFSPGERGTVYAKLTVTDLDNGPGGEIANVRVVEGVARNFFQVIQGEKAEEYLIQVKHPLVNISTNSRVSFTVEATDAGSPSKNAFLTIAFDIITFNTYRLKFNNMFVNIPETATVNSTVYLLKPSVPYHLPNMKVVYTDKSSESPQDRYFRLTDSGAVIVNRQLDSEAVSFVEILFTASDQNNYYQNGMVSGTLRINITDTNDNNPILGNNASNHVIKENAPVGTRVFQVKVSDPDSHPSRLSYHLYSADELPFGLDPSDPSWVVVRSPLDAETMARDFTLRVRITDSGAPLPRGTVGEYRVHLEDVNEFAPIFVHTGCDVWLSRAAAVNTELGRFFAEDLDRDAQGNVRIRVDLESELSQCFAVSGETGILKVMCALSGSVGERKSIVVNLIATDGENDSDKFPVKITLTSPGDSVMRKNVTRRHCTDSNVYTRMHDLITKRSAYTQRLERLLEDTKSAYFNTQPNLHRPKFQVGMPNKLHIQENLPLGTTVYIVMASDEDNGQFSYAGQLVYSLSCSKGYDAFLLKQISNDRARLVVERPLDREIVEYFILNITVCDLGVPRFCTSANLNVFLDDVNDNAPEFTESYPPIYLSEDTPANTKITQLNAIDRDSNSMTHMRYKLVNHRDQFKVHKKYGRLKLLKELDREKQSSYTLVVVASDRGKPSLSTSVELSVRVTDVNDNPPRFDQRAYSLILLQDLPVGAYVTTLLAHDQDEDMNGLVDYSLIGTPEDSNCFRCNQKTGVVTLTCRLNFNQQYRMTAYARDQGSPSLNDQVTFTVRVQGVQANVYPPIFKSPLVSAHVQENQPEGTYVTQLTAIDKEGQSIVYSIVSGSGLGRFRIDNEGTIRTNVPLDCEQSPGYWLLVYAEDKVAGSRSNPGATALALRSFAEVWIEIRDENDNWPMPVAAEYRADVVEGTPAGQEIVRVQAYDLDRTTEALEYNIVRGDPQGYFVIDPLTGIIQTSEKLIDREATLDTEGQLLSEFDLVVSISDDGVPQHTSEVHVFVSVFDLNDNFPRFWHSGEQGPGSNGGFRFRLYLPASGDGSGTPGEDVSDARSEKCIGRVFAQDGDAEKNGTIRYMLAESTAAPLGFDVDETSGRICTKQDLVPGKYSFKVNASDMGKPRLWSKEGVTVKVEIIARTILPPEANANGPTTLKFFDLPSTLIVRESDPRGRRLQRIAALDTTDYGGETLAYSISGGEPFDIDQSVPTDVHLYLAGQLHFTQRSHYILLITVTNGVQSASRRINVTVEEANTQPPKFSKDSYEVEVSEAALAGRSLVQLAASDPDGPQNQLYFSLVASNQKDARRLFKLDDRTGVLSVAQSLDHERVTAHTLIALVRDSGSPLRSAFTRIEVRVLDHNEWAPQFLIGPSSAPGQSPLDEFGKQATEGRGVVRAVVLSTSPPGTVAARVPAYDPDVGDGGRINYTIVEGNWDGLFSIDPLDGTIRVSGSLLPHEGRAYKLTVSARDFGRPPKTNQTTVLLTIRPATGQLPVFERDEYEVTVEENLPAGTVVGSVSATSDGPAFYRLLSRGNELDLFGVTVTTGAVVLRTSVDRERHGDFFRLTVETFGVEGRTDARRGQAVVKIHILDLNDNPPRFLETTLSGQVSEGASPGTIVRDRRGWPLTIRAIDPDFGVNGQLTYEIEDATVNELFAIDPSTGALRVQGSLDREVTAMFDFRVQVRDEGAQKHAARVPARVRVEVLDVNDSPPRFDMPYYVASMVLPTFPGATVLTINATDPDVNNTVKVVITSGNEAGHLALDPTTGALTVVNERIGPDQTFLLFVEATDGTFTSRTNATIFCRQLAGERLALLADTIEAMVPENYTGRQPLDVAVVRVKNAPPGEVFHFTVLNPSPYLRVGELTGVVRTTSVPLDREVVDQVWLLVLVRDRRNRYAHAKVTLTVTDINDCAPVFVDQPYHAILFADSKAGNRSLKVTAIDKDAGLNGSVTYSLDYIRPFPDFHIFELDPHSGYISLTRDLSPDWVGRHLQVGILARDSGTPRILSSTTEVAVQIVSRHSPVFEQSRYRTSVSEALEVGEAVITVQASSPSGGTLLYTLVDGDMEDKFTLDFNTEYRKPGPCVLRTVDRLDYETTRVYRLQLEVTDTGSGLSSRVELVIDVLDVNDEKPVFDSVMYSDSVLENEPIGFKVKRVLANDNDSGDGGKIVYGIAEMAGRDEGSWFSVDASGWLHLIRPLDYERNTLHEFWVTAHDLGTPTLSSKVPVKIQVLDYNDNPPKFEYPAYNVTIADQSEPGTFVVKVTAVDADQSSILTYTIRPHLNHTYFRIDGREGRVTFVPPSSGGKWKSLDALAIEVEVSDGVYSMTAPVRVALSPSNHMAPRFEQRTRYVTVRENEPAGSWVANLTAQDSDKGEFGRVTLSIPSEEHRRWFQIEPTTGELRLARSLDRELKEQFRVLVLARDGGGLLDYQTVYIHVKDVNDNAPRFRQKKYEVTVTPSMYAAGTDRIKVIQVQADDPDTGASGRVMYQFSTSAVPPIATARVFSISQSGDVSLSTNELLEQVIRSKQLSNASDNSTLTFASAMAGLNGSLSNQGVWQFFVEACDEGKPQTLCSDPVEVVVYVLEREPAQMPSVRCILSSLLENNRVGDRVAVCKSIPASLEGEWHLLEGSTPKYNSPPAFKVNRLSGLVSAERILDYETLPRYELAVQFKSFSGPPLVASQTLRVDVLDINDCSPEFEARNYRLSVPEDVPVGSRLLQALAHDRDMDGKDRISYDLRAITPGLGEIKRFFRIDSEGWLHLLRAFDRETISRFEFEVIARDQESHVNRTNVVIELIDVNDSPLEWTGKRIADRVEVVEGSDVPREVYALRLADLDEKARPEVRFFVENGSDGAFEVTSEGKVRVVVPLDREMRERYLLKIRATDGVFTTQEVFSLEVVVRDVNDNAPVCSQPEHELLQPESLPPGSLLVTLTASDRDAGDNAKISYTMVSGDPLLFSVGRQTGTVHLANKLDRETASEHTLRVNASDRTGLFCLFTVRLVVVDVNDNAPVFTALGVSPIPEDAPVGSLVGKIHAEDADQGFNRRVRYSVIGSDTSFSVDRVSGFVRVARPLDREKQASHSMVVQAEDMGKPVSLSTTATVTVVLLDVNDSPPRFVNNRLSVRVSEGESLNKTLVRVVALSADEGQNAVIHYRLLTKRQEFQLTPDTGDLILSGSLDYERTRVYYLTVEAADGGTPPLSSTTVVTVHVEDVNDNPPRFPDLDYQFSVVENSPRDTHVGQVGAMDPDSGDNGRVTYSLLHGTADEPNLSAMFSLDPDSGALRLLASPDRETVSEYALTVRAMDAGQMPLSSTAKVIVRVEDVNDNSPTFDKDKYVFVVQVDRDGNITSGKESSDARVEIGRLKITDRDASPNGGPFNCILLGGNLQTFAIRNVSGDECVITVIGRLPVGTQMLRVRVNDNGLTARYNQTHVMVNVVRQSNIPPEIVRLNVTVTYYRLAVPVGEVTRVTVKDRTPYDDLQFSLVSHMEKVFTIDSFRGTVRAITRLDNGLYPLRIRVTNGSLSSESTIFIKVVALTEEMVSESCVVRIDNLPPNLFFMEAFDRKLQDSLGRVMGVDGPTMVYILSVQNAPSTRVRRDLSGESRNAVDVLVAVYNPKENAFFAAKEVKDKVGLIASELKEVFGGDIAVFYDICTRKSCTRGRCVTSTSLDTQGRMNRVEVHKVSHASPVFKLEKNCICQQNYGGTNCDVQLNECARHPCKTPKVCEPQGENKYRCVCPPMRTGSNCERLKPAEPDGCTDLTCFEEREKSALMFSGGSYMNWTLLHPDPKQIELAWSMRTKQLDGPVFKVRWNSLREFVVRLSGGRLSCSASVDGFLGAEWLISASGVNDGRWHMARFRLTAMPASVLPTEEKQGQKDATWWTELTVDGIEPVSRRLESWQLGESSGQEIVMGADVGPLVVGYTRLRDSFVGCIKDVRVNAAKLPYQTGYIPSSSALLTQSSGIKFGCSESFMASACQSNPCKNGAPCVPRQEDPSLYQCKCRPPFEGPHCEVNTDPCALLPCRNGGKCKASGGSYLCECPTGLSGSHCEQGRYCGLGVNPCLHGAECRESPVGPICVCPKGYRGARCEHDVDECKETPLLCSGRGICVNRPGSFYCNCSLGWAGQRCEREGLVVLRPDTNPLGLAQDHVYIIIGVLAALFLAALLTIAMLVFKYRRTQSRFNRHRRQHQTLNDLEKDSRIQMLPLDSGGPGSYSRPNSFCSRTSSMTPSHHPHYCTNLHGKTPAAIAAIAAAQAAGNNYISYNVSPPPTPMSNCQYLHRHHHHPHHPAADRLSVCSSVMGGAASCSMNGGAGRLGPLPQSNSLQMHHGERSREGSVDLNIPGSAGRKRKRAARRLDHTLQENINRSVESKETVRKSLTSLEGSTCGDYHWDMLDMKQGAPDVIPDSPAIHSRVSGQPYDSEEEPVDDADLEVSTFLHPDVSKATGRGQEAEAEVANYALLKPNLYLPEHQLDESTGDLRGIDSVCPTDGANGSADTSDASVPLLHRQQAPQGATNGKGPGKSASKIRAIETEDSDLDSKTHLLGRRPGGLTNGGTQQQSS